MHSFSIKAESVLQFAFYILLKQFFTDEIDKLGALGAILVSCDIEFNAI